MIPYSFISMNLDQIKKAEETKREKACDPVARWKQIQAMITWAEANMPAQCRRNVPRIRRGFLS